MCPVPEGNYFFNIINSQYGRPGSDYKNVITIMIIITTRLQHDYQLNVFYYDSQLFCRDYNYDYDYTVMIMIATIITIE